MKKQIFVALLAVMMLSGCMIFHSCTEACFPMCELDRKKVSRFIVEYWEKIKAYRPLIYTPVGIPELDDFGRRTQYLSQRITNEIIIPYVELDKEGLIEVYQEYQESVKLIIKSRECTVAEAGELIRQDWEKTQQGRESWAKLQKMKPLIEAMRADSKSCQVLRTTAIITPQLPVMIKDISILIKRVTNIFNTGDNVRKIAVILKISTAGIQITGELIKLEEALAYLCVLNLNRYAQERAIAQNLGIE